MGRRTRKRICPHADTFICLEHRRSGKKKTPHLKKHIEVLQRFRDKLERDLDNLILRMQEDSDATRTQAEADESEAGAG